MPTTTYTDTATGVRAIGNRTDSAGAAVGDVTAEEDRLVHAYLAEGALTTNAFKVAQQAAPDMTVKVGSGTAKADVYVVEGDATGQGNYTVRLDAASVNVTISAAEPSSARIDEIYLVVLDSPYDGNTLGTASAPLAIPRLAYRKGDAGGAAPGPDAIWDAHALLATIDVAAAVTTITDADITDERADTSFAGRIAAADLSSQGSVGIIAFDTHDPASPTAGDGEYSSTSSTLADVDATDLAVTFTAPPSGKVKVTLEAVVGAGDGSTSNEVFWGLRESSTTIDFGVVNGATNARRSASRAFVVTGLTAASSHTYKWAARLSTGGVSLFTVLCGGDYGPATMTVEALP